MIGISQTLNKTLVMQLVLDTNGLILKSKAGSFSIQQNKEHRLISPKSLNSIAITKNCLISSAAVKLAADHEIPIYIFNNIGDPVGCFRSPYFESLAKLRREQVYFDESTTCRKWIAELFKFKTIHQIDFIRYLNNRKPSLKSKLEELEFFLNKNIDLLKEVSLDESFNKTILGWEGQIGKNYWPTLSAVLPNRWQFHRRSRRPALDGFNAALNYLYGMLYTVVEQAIFAAGLDPHLGFLHEDQYNAATLSFDIIEPFRPFIDQLIVQEFMFNTELDPSFFDSSTKGVYLNKRGKALFIPKFNLWLASKSKNFGKNRKNKLHIYQYTGDLAKLIKEHR